MWPQIKLQINDLQLWLEEKNTEKNELRVNLNLVWQNHKIAGTHITILLMKYILSLEIIMIFAEGSMCSESG